MKKKTNSILLSSFIIFAIISCNNSSKFNKKNNIAEYSKIEKAINNCIGWAINKDFDLLFSVIANDSNYLSIHPTDNIVRGFKEFNENCNFFRSPDFKAVSHEVKDLKITISNSGHVAWFYCILDDFNEWKG